MNVDLLIFDCDGTLVDSEYLNNLALVQIMTEEGLHQYDLDYSFAHWVGLRLKHIIEQVARETGHVFPPDMSARYVARTHELAPHYLKRIEGAEELVVAAAQHGPVCVASNGQRTSVVESLVMTGLKKYFTDDKIFTAVEVPNGKPAPDLFFHVAKKMNVPPTRCLVIEDSVPGVIGAVAAGMRVLGFANASHMSEDYAAQLKNAGAESVFDTLIHIKNALYH